MERTIQFETFRPRDVFVDREHGAQCSFALGAGPLVSFEENLHGLILQCTPEKEDVLVLVTVELGDRPAVVLTVGEQPSAREAGARSPDGMTGDLMLGCDNRLLDAATRCNPTTQDFVGEA
nr:hypothetical protein [Rhodococcus pseudokoreensis]